MSEQTDRQLLELAAKAEGRSIKYMTEIKRDGSQEEFIACWNPLTNDGDAFRLACTLELDVQIIGDGMCNVRSARLTKNVFEHHPGGNTELATKRCIVLTAAEIGKAMP